MKKAFLVHGWGGSSESSWRPWLKKELEKKGFSVSVPAMPDTEHPKMDAWVKQLAKTVGTPGKDCYFVGHSLGCITILRYLESLKGKVGGVVLVAGFSDNLGFKEIDSFFVKPLDWEKIRSRCRRFVAIHSITDRYVPLRHGKIFRDKLGAETIVVKKMGHFSRVKELPVVLEAVMKISA
jgi:predicted alpha/beta hydrolase family esterase